VTDTDTHTDRQTDRGKFIFCPGHAYHWTDNNRIRHMENCFFSPYVIFLGFKGSLGFDECQLSYRLRYTCFNALYQHGNFTEFYCKCVSRPAAAATLSPRALVQRVDWATLDTASSVRPRPVCGRILEAAATTRFSE